MVTGTPLWHQAVGDLPYANATILLSTWHGTMLTCSKLPCAAPIHACGLCREHYKPGRRTKDFSVAEHGPSCSVTGCERPFLSKGLCRKHYSKLWRYGDANFEVRPRWPGGSRVHRGYVYIKVDGKRIAEHRHVMEQHLMRKLRAGENVHHINGNRSDNCIENLELWTSSQPSGQRVADKVAWARALLEAYGDEF